MTRAAVLIAFAPALLSAERQLDVPKLEGLIAAQMSADSIPAISVAVATGGELRWSGAYGLQDMENFTPAKTATAFRYASVSKPITAVLALRLAEAGRLDLDTPIQRYVPSFLARQSAITPRLLMAQLSGVRHYRNYSEINSSRHYKSLADALAVFQDDPLVSDPGSRFTYTTFGYTLLGVAIEAACGKPFDECLREWVLTPAAMHRTAVDNVYALIPHRARGYGRDRSGKVINTDLIDTSNKIPGGGLAGTAEDLIRFAAAVWNGRLLKSETRTLMWTNQKLPDATTTGYGLGWSIVRETPLLVGHSGGQAGATAMLLVDPGRGDAVAVLCNMEQARGVAPFAEQVLRLIAGRD